MERRSMLVYVVVVVCNLIVIPTCCHCHYYSKSLPYTPAEKVTELHFFFHDTINGENPSAIKVAHPSFPTAFNDTPGPFGSPSIFVINDLVTAGPEKTSQVTSS
ncbi:hypothetical protein like AT2G21110 [Hibiscus trionum]|uniref:Dirigent protein n=1 Tax=Hibiscus trionum TaxID=183268 RepID=A0A9W7LPL6_HIBTR|nr:hypothetical protein like AT2G21110 [Hibiscus trionum]